MLLPNSLHWMTSRSSDLTCMIRLCSSAIRSCCMFDFTLDSNGKTVTCINCCNSFFNVPT